MYGYNISGASGWYLPMLCEYDLNTNKLYRKAYIVNADWGYEGSRAQVSINKGMYSNFFEFQSQLYAQYGEQIVNITPYTECTRREEIFENQL